jgi:hypothetical protein
MTEDDVRANPNLITSYFLMNWRQVSELFWNEFKDDKINWETISYRPISEEFMRKFQDKLNWNLISYNQDMTEPFIIEFIDRLDVEGLLDNDNLTMDKTQLRLLLDLYNV